MRSVHIIVKGRVHGVGFRYNSKKKADSFGITGYVKNVDEGVEIKVEGDDKKIDAFIDWCKKGPFFANVDSVYVEDSENMGFDSFEIRF